MRKYALLLFLASLSAPLWGQNYTFPTINNDSAVHQFSMPIPCPSTNAPDCAGPHNAALNGKNSVWAECDFDNSGGIANPECSGSTQQVVASSAAAAVTNKNYVHIVRATDASVFGNAPFAAGSDGGQMGENGIDATNTRMVFQSGASFVVFSFDPDPTSPTYLQATRLYPGHSSIGYASYFSRQPPPYPGGRTVSYWYTLLLGSNVPGGGSLTASHVYLTQWDFSNTSTYPSLGSGITAYDLSVNGCLGSSFNTSTWTRVVSNSLMVSYDDNYFNAAFSNTGANCVNGSGPSNCRDLLLVYDRPNNKCIVYRSDLGQVTNEAGVTSNIIEQNSGRNFVTDTTGDGSPNFFVGGLMYIEAVPGTCTPTNSPNPCPVGYGDQRWTWETGIPYPGNASPTGNKAWAISSTGKCCSHRAAGFSNFLGYSDPGVGYYQPQWIFNTTASTQTAIDANNTINFNTCFTPNTTTAHLCVQEDHKTWSLNTDGTDVAPFLDLPYPDSVSGVANGNTGASTPLNVPWNMELDLWPTSCYPSGCGPTIKPWRPSHTFINVQNGLTNGNYSETTGTASISSHPVHGNIFIAWTSNWQGQLGCQNGTYDTTNNPPGLGCPGQADRYDVFIAQVPVTSPQTFYFFWHI